MPHSPSETRARPGLRAYLHGHHLAACVGAAAFERAARSQADAKVREELSSLSREVDEDRSSLESILERCGLGVSPARRRVAGAVARARTVLPRSPGRQPRELADLLELEALTTAVHGKLLGWVALRHCVDDGRLDDDELDRLIHRAEDQEHRLERMRRDTAVRGLGPVG